MPVGALIGGAVGLIGAKKSSDAQKDAARAQQRVSERQFKMIRKDLSPYRRIGGENLVRYDNALRDGGYTMSPYEQWAADQGRRGVEASAAARGGMFSGATLNAIGDRQQQIAGGFRENYLNRLGGLAEMGQNAAVQTGAAGQTMAGQVAQAQGNYGNAASAGWAGMSNAITGGIQNWQGQQQYNNALAMYRQANGLTAN